jgi:hypothetical protein
MSALVKKEIRLLLPAWIVAMLLALVQAITRPYDFYIASLLFFGLTMLALSSIGREVSLNTFSTMLAHPTERLRIWQTKLSVLAVAFLTVLIVWLGAFGVAFINSNVDADNRDTSFNLFFTICLIATATYTGGLWTALLLRQLAGAFWLTLLVPATLSGFTAAFFAVGHSDNVVIAALCIIIAAYSVGGFFYARWLFFRAQDVGWSGGILTLPEWRWMSARVASAPDTRRHRPIISLVKKEMQLQQVSFLGAAGLLVLHIGIVVLRTHHKFDRDSAGEVLTSIFWMLWLVLPVVIGGMAIAEERRLGVMENQSCLPVTRRVQFIIKCLLAVLLGVLFGGVMPYLLETIGKGSNVWSSSSNDVLSLGLIVTGLSLWLSLVSFFASSLARNFLQAVGYAILTAIVTASMLSALVHGRMFFLDYMPVFFFLPVIVAVPTLIITLLLLSSRNFRDYCEGWPLWRRNLLGLGGALVFTIVASAALYNRVWEVFEAAEPAHGPAKFTEQSPSALHRDIYGNLLVYRPTGQVWVSRLGYDHVYYSGWNNFRSILQTLLNPLPTSVTAQNSIADSNWVSATASHVEIGAGDKDGQRMPNITGYLDTIGIKTDGTLWISEPSKNGLWNGGEMNQFGDGTNWQQVIRLQSASALLLKHDGTLWLWGTNHFNWDGWQTNWPTLDSYQPYQIGTDSIWKAIYSYWGCLARKSDGSVWKVGLNDKSGRADFFRDTNLDQVSLKTVSFSGSGTIGYVRPDGTLWVSLAYRQQNTVVYSNFVQFGAGPNWTAVALNSQRMVALKSDGSLWQWDYFPSWNITPEQLKLIAQKRPVRLGIHNDWVAIVNTWDNVIALAADGSLWLWPDRAQYEQSTLLKLPKQPDYLANVFDGSN